MARERNPWGLTPREQEVARELMGFHSDAEIAMHLGISPRTVRQYTASIRRKLEVSSRREIAMKLNRLSNP